MMWFLPLNACEKTSATSLNLNGYSVKSLRELWESCASSIRMTHGTKASPLLIQISCDCYLQWTIENYDLKTLDSITPGSKKAKEYATLMKLKCNKYRY